MLARRRSHDEVVSMARKKKQVDSQEPRIVQTGEAEVTIEGVSPSSIHIVTARL